MKPGANRASLEHEVHDGRKAGVKRAGKTETLSISLAPGPLKLLRERAKRVHRGNLSAAIAEAAELLRRDIAMGDLVAELERQHGPLTDADRARIDAELRGAGSQGDRRPRKRKKAA
jgi:hypothetical protein